MTPNEFKAETRLTRHWFALNAALILLFSLSIGICRTKGSLSELVSTKPLPASSNLKVDKDLRFDVNSLEQVNNKIKILDRLEKTDLPEAGDGEPKRKSLFSRFMGIANTAVAPAQSYYDLVSRYRSWRIEYNKLQKQFGNKPNGEPKLRDALDILRLEYVKVDEMLVREACSSKSLPGHGKKAMEDENMDLIFKILTLLIGRLEENLAHLKAHGLDSAELDAEEDQEAEEKIKEIESKVEKATARAKRIASGSMFKLAKRELFAIAKLIVLDTMATYVVNTANRREPDLLGGLMGRIAPFIMLIGSVNTSLLVSYLRNVQFRSAINVVNYSYTMFTCKRLSAAQ